MHLYKTFAHINANNLTDAILSRKFCFLSYNKNSFVPLECLPFLNTIVKKNTHFVKSLKNLKDIGIQDILLIFLNITGNLVNGHPINLLFTIQ